MTYFVYIQDRIDAAKTVEPSRCGWGLMLSLAALGSIYSVVYTVVAINPESTLAKMTASDPAIPKGFEDAKPLEFGAVWWSDYRGRCWGSTSASRCSHFTLIQAVTEVGRISYPPIELVSMPKVGRAKGGPLPLGLASMPSINSKNIYSK